MILKTNSHYGVQMWNARNNPMLSSRGWIGTWTNSAIFTKQNYWSKSFEDNRPWNLLWSTQSYLKYAIFCLFFNIGGAI